MWICPEHILFNVRNITFSPFPSGEGVLYFRGNGYRKDHPKREAVSNEAEMQFARISATFRLGGNKEADLYEGEFFRG